MKEKSKEKSMAKIPAILACKCPRCRKGDMFKTKNAYDFKNYMRMHEKCPVCSDYFDKEVGFFYGSSYISYGLTVGISGLTFVIWWLTVGFSLYDNRLLYWLIANAVLLIVLQPILMRLARTMWLDLFVPYDKDWKIHPAKKPAEQNDKLKNAW